MSKWFECKVKYLKMMEDGKEKMVNEPYLIDAVSFTEAESRINKEMEAYIGEDFTISNIKVSNLSEIVPDPNGDRWFKCKVAFITLDETKDVEKKSNSYVLYESNNIKEAYESLRKYYSDTVNEFEITAISESPILDVFPYSSDKDIPDNLTPLSEVE